MAHRTLNQLIASVIPDAEAADGDLSDSGEDSTESTVPSAAPPEEVEKLASFLEAIASAGIENILEKSAKDKRDGKGHPANNAHQQLRGSLDLTGKGNRKTHPALQSNQAAIDFDQRENSKIEAPQLDHLLKHKSFSDPTLKQKLTNAAGKGDPNIHAHRKHASHDLDKIRAELAKRLADQQPTEGRS